MKATRAWCGADWFVESVLTGVYEAVGLAIGSVT